MFAPRISSDGNTRRWFTLADKSGTPGDARVQI
jgi:hypothetical protein